MAILDGGRRFSRWHESDSRVAVSESNSAQSNASRTSIFFSESFCLIGCFWLTTQFSRIVVDFLILDRELRSCRFLVAIRCSQGLLFAS